MEITYTEGSHKKPSLVDKSHLSLNIMEKSFEQRYSFNQINNIITEHLSSLKTNASAPNQSGIYTSGCQRGANLFNSAIEDLKKIKELKKLSSLHYFIFWMCDWWNYSSLVRNLNYALDDFIELRKRSRILLREYIVPVLPEEIREQVKSMQVISAVCNQHHFAILFNDSEAIESCIVSDTRFITLNDIDGKDAYIADISSKGILNTADFLDRNGTHIYLKDN